jgi:hypothetical protein
VTGGNRIFFSFVT